MARTKRTTTDHRSTFPICLMILLDVLLLTTLRLIPTEVLCRRLIHRSAWRDCMKSGSRRVFRYSSTHEKEIPDGSIRRRMELHRTPHARPQRTRTAENPHSSRDFERHLLPPKERLPVAPTAARLSSMAHRLPLLQEMAHRWYLGEDQPSSPRTPAGALEARSRAQRGCGGFPVGQEYRGGRGTARLRWGQEGQGQKTPHLGGHRGFRAQGEGPQRQGDGLRGHKDAAAAGERAIP